MGKISSYGIVSSPSFSDKLLGTKVNGGPINGTYNFTIQQLSDLISGQVNLQKVLNAGNTATQDIKLTGNFYISNRIYDYLNSAGNSGNVLSSTNTGVKWITLGLQQILNTSNTATQDINLTGKITTTNIQINGALVDGYNTTGVLGQVLSSTNTGVKWINYTTPTLQNVLNTGNTATQDINITGIINATTFKGTYLRDSTNSLGTVGQLLSSTITGTKWASSTLQSILSAGNTATENITIIGTIFSSNIKATGALYLDGYLRDIFGQVGNLGQVLSSTGTGTQWKNLTLQNVLDAGNTATGTINITGSITTTDLFINGYIRDYLNSSGNSGQVLSSTGNSVKWINSPPPTLQEVLDKNNTATQDMTINGIITTSHDAVINQIDFGRGTGDDISNIIIGNTTFIHNSTGYDTISIGRNSLSENIDGYGNISIGRGSLVASTSSYRTISIGVGTMTSAIAYTDSVGIGYQVATRGSVNSVSIGYQSGLAGINCVSIGYQALALNQTNTVNDNVAIGYKSLNLNGYGTLNTAVGSNSLLNNGSGGGNVAIGADAGRYVFNSTANTSTANSVFIGYNTRSSSNGDNESIVIGTMAVGLGSYTTVIGNYNTQNAFIWGNLILGAVYSFSGGNAKLKVTGGIAANNLINSYKGLLFSDGYGKINSAYETINLIPKTSGTFSVSIGNPFTPISSARLNIEEGTGGDSAGCLTLYANGPSYFTFPIFTIKDYMQNDIFTITRLGNINVQNMPNSDIGLFAGDLWNDSGVVRIV